MLKDTLFRQPRQAGLQVVQPRGHGGAERLTTRRVCLSLGATASLMLEREEAIVVLQEGRGTFAAGPARWPVSRSDVFSERATAMYVPPGIEIVVHAESPLEAIVFSTEADTGDVDPPQGFGQQMLYTEDGECVTHTVRDGDAVLLPYGYHPVSAPPGYQLYYLWALAGEQRNLALHEDPAHQWIHSTPI